MTPQEQNEANWKYAWSIRGYKAPPYSFSEYQGRIASEKAAGEAAKIAAQEKRDRKAALRLQHRKAA